MNQWVWYLCFATVAQAQTGYLTYATGINPSGIAAADLNGDGKPDLGIASSGSNFLTILLNDGTGSFTAVAPVSLGQTSLLAPTYAEGIVPADLNGDGKTDLVAITGTGPAILLGNGDGTFQAPLVVSGCPSATGVQVADLNGDGIPDLAATCLVSGRWGIPIGAYLLVLPGKGDGTFGPSTEYDLEGRPWAVLTIGDFNQDGKPDVAVATGNTLTVFLNDGKGNFKPVSSNNEPWNYAPGIAAADFNGDGILDLAVTSQSDADPALGTIAVLLGRGDGTFRAAPSLQTAGYGPIVAMDLNGDGHADLAAGCSALVFFAGRGDGTFESGYPFGGSGSIGAFALADFTGSGVMGFAGANGFETPESVFTAGSAVILPRAVWPSLSVANVSGAGFGLGPMAPGSIATSFGSNLAAGAAAVSVTDSAGATRPAQLYFVSSGQVNYVIPPDTASGLATVDITDNGHTTASGQLRIAPVAPALFVVNSDNLAAANVLRVSQNGDRTFESIYQTDPNGGVTALPIDFGSAADTVYLSLYGTGIRNLSSLTAVSATVNWQFSAPVTYAGPQGTYAGLDQVNVQLPSAVAAAGPGTIVLQLTVDGQPSNRVTLSIQ